MISSQDLQILSSTHLFSGFSEEALRALCAALRPSVAELPRGRVLWRMGERVTQAGVILSGRVEAWHYSASGHADLAAVHEAGGVFGDVLMSAQTVGSPVELRTAADSRIFFLSLASLLALCAAGGGEDCAHLLENLLREVSEITHFERGSALISTNNNNVAVEIKCSELEKELITTDRRELQELLKRNGKTS